MTQEWFTSDHHFWHEGGIEYNERPFKTVEEMNEVLIKNWNESIKPEDKVYILGDFAFAGVAKTTAIIEQLNGYKILIMGNHDYRNHKPEKWQKLGMDVVKNCGRYVKDELTLMLSHFPYAGYMLDDRKFVGMPDECILDNKGEFLVHGHVHKGWKRRGKMINVGVDVWNFKPVSMQDIINEINEYLKEKKYESNKV